MKQPRLILWCGVLCLVLLASPATAVFARAADSEAKPAEVKEYTTDGKMHQPDTELKPWMPGVPFMNPFLMPDYFAALTFDWRKLVLDAVVGQESDAVFWFTRNRVVYLNMGGDPPTSVQIDQKPWKDLKEPFVLDFVPDFATALESENVSADGNVTMTMSPGPTGVILRIGNGRKTAAPIQYKMSMQIDKTRTHRLKQSQSAGVESQQESDPVATKDVVESLKKKPGQGKDDEATLTIEGDVHKSAVFLMKGSTLVYKDGAWEGMYPAHVTVNGKPWKNLEDPFELDFVPDYGTATAYTWFSVNDVERTFNVATARERLVLTVTNIGEPMTHFRHTLRLRKKPGAKPSKLSQDDRELMVYAPYSIDAAEPFLAEEPIIIPADNAKKAQGGKAQ